MILKCPYTAHCDRLGPLCSTSGAIVSLTAQKESYDELVDTLKKHFDPKPIIVTERFHSYRRNQGQSESISDYLVNLRHVTSQYKFSVFLQEGPPDK